MKRDPATIRAAHTMDSDRRELYVEGVHDKTFLEWVFNGAIGDNCQIITIDFVDIPETTEGGNRSRLISLMVQMEPDGFDIRGLADSDQHRLTEDAPALPTNLWITDFRDLEAYVLTETNVDAALRAGCGLSQPPADRVLAAAVAAARFFAAVRVYSTKNDLRLPVGKSEWERHVSCPKPDVVDLDRERVIKSLMQRADISLRRFSEVAEGIAEVARHLEREPDRQVVHGKDFARIMTRQLAAAGIKVDTARRILFPSFDRSTVSDFPVLREVGEYLAS